MEAFLTFALVVLVLIGLVTVVGLLKGSKVKTRKETFTNWWKNLKG